MRVTVSLSPLLVFFTLFTALPSLIDSLASALVPRVNRLPSDLSLSLVSLHVRLAAGEGARDSHQPSFKEGVTRVRSEFHL